MTEQAPGCDTCSKRDHAECPCPGARSCSDWEMQHYDTDDKRVTLNELCRKEPAWAANIIRTTRAELDRERGEVGRASLLANLIDTYCADRCYDLSLCARCPLRGSNLPQPVTGGRG